MKGAPLAGYFNNHFLWVSLRCDICSQHFWGLQVTLKIKKYPTTQLKKIQTNKPNRKSSLQIKAGDENQRRQGYHIVIYFGPIQFPKERFTINFIW